jgi:hypothetical protein
MKSLILTSVMALMIFAADAKPMLIDYVLTDDGITYFQKVKFNYSDNYLIGVTESGEKIKFSRNEIQSFRKDGVVYNRAKLEEKGKACDNCVFMKLLKTRHGFNLYAFDCYDCNGQPVQKCFVYKGDQKVLEVDNENYRQIISFFKMKYN